MIDYTFHPEAEAEFGAAAIVYEAQSVGVGTAFVAAVERAILFIRTYPEAGAPVSRSIRRHPVSFTFRHLRRPLSRLTGSQECPKQERWAMDGVVGPTSLSAGDR
mgnify:CR=1 FL=1